MFNITYYPVFQNVKNILQKLNLLLAPDKEYNVSWFPAVWFRNGKSLKDYLVRAALRKTIETWKWESCGSHLTWQKLPQLLQRKPARKLSKFIVALEIAEIVTRKNYCTFWNVRYVLRPCMLVESKLSFDISSISIKANIELSGERIEKYLETFLNPRWSAGINDWNFILFE